MQRMQSGSMIYIILCYYVNVSSKMYLTCYMKCNYFSNILWLISTYWPILWWCCNFKTYHSDSDIKVPICTFFLTKLTLLSTSNQKLWRCSLPLIELIKSSYYYFFIGHKKITYYLLISSIVIHTFITPSNKKISLA